MGEGVEASGVAPSHTRISHMYYCKICDRVDEQGIGGHHTRCNPKVVHTVVHAKVVHAQADLEGNLEKVSEALHRIPMGQAPSKTSRQRRKAVAHDEVRANPVATDSRHGKYADPEKRKAYRKEWMRKKRGTPGRAAEGTGSQSPPQSQTSET